MEKDLIFIRHAQSCFNLASHNYRVEHNLPYIWSQLCKFDQFLKQVKYNPEFLDCGITQKGEQQCIEAREAAVAAKADVILVSPLDRALQTCSNIFGQTQTPIFVQPLLAQALRSSCDISHSIQIKVHKYPNYDWTAVKEKGDLWFIDNDSEQNKKKYFGYLNKQGIESFEQRQKGLLKFMGDTMIYEEPTNVRSRVKKVKMLLNQYRKKYNRIAVVSHYNIINFILAEGWNQTSQPADSLDVRNCQVYETSLQRLMDLD